MTPETVLGARAVFSYFQRGGYDTFLDELLSLEDWQQLTIQWFLKYLCRKFDDQGRDRMHTIHIIVDGFNELARHDFALYGKDCYTKLLEQNHQEKARSEQEADAEAIETEVNIVQRYRKRAREQTQSTTRENDHTIQDAQKKIARTEDVDNMAPDQRPQSSDKGHSNKEKFWLHRAVKSSMSAALESLSELHNVLAIFTYSGTSYTPMKELSFSSGFTDHAVSLRLLTPISRQMLLSRLGRGNFQLWGENVDFLWLEGHQQNIPLKHAMALTGGLPRFVEFLLMALHKQVEEKRKTCKGEVKLKDLDFQLPIEKMTKEIMGWYSFVASALNITAMLVVLRYSILNLRIKGGLKRR